MSFDKRALLVELASARAELFSSLLGLDEPGLSATKVDVTEAEGARTVKDILAHIAAWETWTTNQLRMVQSGRSAELARVDVEGDNTRIHAERRDWPLCRVMAEMTNAHTSLVYEVERADTALLDGRHPAPWGSVRPARWLEKSADHDARHAAELADWRKQAGLVERVPGPGCVLLPGLTAARDELLGWVSLIPEGRRASLLVCGEWTAQDVLGHVTDWERYVVSALADMLAGRLGGAEYGDNDDWNARHAAARRGQSWDRVWADLMAARGDLLAIVGGLTDAALAKTAPSRWNATDTICGMALVPLEHDREHAQGVRAAVTVTGT